MTGETTDAGVGEQLTVEQASALTGDDIAYWLNNPFMSPELVADKVCFWLDAVRRKAADDRADQIAQAFEDRCKCYALTHPGHAHDCGLTALDAADVARESR